MALKAALVWKQRRADVTAGLTVALVALPLALAFGVASGAGPAAGLYAAIFGGFVTSLFGGSGVQISGPTGAMTVVLVDIVSGYGVEGMLLAGALAGVLQLLLGLLRLGRLVKFLPHAVVSGFTNGIATLIFLSQVAPALQEPSIAAVTIAVMVLGLRYGGRSVPASLWGLAAGILVNELLVQTPHVVGPIPSSLPRPALPLGRLEAIGDLLLPAVTICLLGTIEALLSAEVGDFMTGQRHDSNRELIGQGLGNLVSALVGGVPVTGAIARSAVNAKSGGRTRLAGMVHSVILLLMVLALGPWAARIPLASLAAILMVTAVRMADLEGLRLLPRARWTYGATLLLTMVLTVIRDLTVAVLGGLALAGLIAMAELASPAVRPQTALRRGAAAAAALPRHPELQVVVLYGPLFFVGVEKLRAELEKVSPSRVLVLDLSPVSAVDESGALMLKRLARDLRAEGRSLYLAGLGRNALRLLARLGVLDEIGRERVSLGIRVALRRALREADGTAAVGLPAAPLPPAPADRPAGGL